ncbi:hypothetical protein UFOVP1357_41 [uncultured Caudovirales phage]|uniref:Uncharacterized protein n=1 Tax=uncultured Caudovirales phage TaxID=2100421 RepID=A0A6J5LE66_9CAUD|nr:hypothetical protein UFOVP18_31 [uncultured Caudovirales phage]CAB4126900.1 hypothetical protein UFOVP82_33 [uncultured Caudovirales phage]CAB4132481.1 hypothetical protein UFOVP258_24 [uncultured Caudovirales phage]CAB4146368.1 hypothetical protein UFOVP502_16 [uncultured Caudovirales phage]CAB4200348.1 hypothetical protein UFOVP1357_41 [uncultured Caudovirales phage]
MKEKKVDRRKFRTNPFVHIIDMEKLDELIIQGKSCKEIAVIFKLHPTTLTNRIRREKGVVFTHYQSRVLRKSKQLDKLIKYGIC